MLPCPSRVFAAAAAAAILAAPAALSAAPASAAAPTAKAAAWPFPTLKPAGKPLVVGHRGASGYLPEHTLASYSLAITQGADYIEPDLEATKDGVLVARHEPNIIDTTDVESHPEFASRKKTVLLDGAPTTGFFVSDFTLAEIKTLRAKQPMASRPQQYNGRYAIPTLDEIIELAKRRSKTTGRTIGVFPETKHPTYHERIGLPLEPKVVAVLKRQKWNTRTSPVILQSFEPGSLKKLKKLSPVKRVQLIDANDVNDDGSLNFDAPYDRPYDWTTSGDAVLLGRTFAFLTTNAGLDEVKSYADGIGPWKRYIVSTVKDPALTGPGEAARRLAPPSDLVARAHARGLTVIPYTFRNEASRLPADYGDNPQEEYRQFYALGVDGVFSDFPDTAVTARTLLSIDVLAAR